MSVYHAPSGFVCLVVVGDSRVRFDLAYMCCVAFCVSIFDDVVGVCKEVSMGVLCASKRVEGIIA